MTTPNRNINRNIDYFETGDPIRNLWCAVIQEALNPIVGRNTHFARTCQKRKNFSEKRNYILMKQRECNQRINKLVADHAKWFFTSDNSRFEWICQQLGFSSNAIRSVVDKLIS